MFQNLPDFHFGFKNQNQSLKSNFSGMYLIDFHSRHLISRDIFNKTSNENHCQTGLHLDL